MFRLLPVPAALAGLAVVVFGAIGCSAADGVTSRSTPAGHGDCINVTGLKHPSQGATVGGVRAGPFGQTLRNQSGGAAKFWVGQDPFVGPAEALIRVTALDSGTIAYYERAWSRRATPMPPDSTRPTGPPFYPGSIMLPRSGTQVRISVTIGPASGCFVFTV